MLLAPMSAPLASSTFRAQLAEAVGEVEAGSSVELVVLVAPRSGLYPEVGAQLGLTLLVAVLTFLVFHDAEYGDYLLYLAPLAACAIGFALPVLLPSLRRLASRRARARNVELVARASFQKAGLSATRDATALLVYASVLEREVYLVPDRGVIAAVPAAWFLETERHFRTALCASDPAVALLGATRALAPELARYLPKRLDDMNELPNAIDLVF
jgi:putative membrane protein